MSIHGTGFEVDVFIIDFNAYQTIIKANPFLNKDIEIEKLYISFLSDIPDENLFEEFKSTTYNLDQLQLIGKAIYLFFPDGYSQTKLNNNFIEKKLKVKATTRNWKTSTKLLEILNETK